MQAPDDPGARNRSGQPATWTTLRRDPHTEISPARERTADERGGFERFEPAASGAALSPIRRPSHQDAITKTQCAQRRAKSGDRVDDGLARKSLRGDPPK